jgi:hypothetical protein
VLRGTACSYCAGDPVFIPRTTKKKKYIYISSLGVL